MSLPRYPRYRESGIEWLGEVPAHWESVRLGSLFRETDDVGSDELPVLRVSIHDGVSDRELNEDEQDRKVTRSEDRTKYKRVQRGDLVYNMMRAWQGGFGSVTVPGMVSPAYVVARPLSKIRTEFVEQLLRTPQAVEELRRHSQGVTDFRLRLYWDEFKSIKIALPTAEEQGEILDRLGPETARIDVLIAEQKRLIQLLTEKRRAIISHAVTKGLDPTVPMKDSGIDWIGDVPRHWHLAPIKSIVNTLEQGWSPQCEGYPAETTGEWGVLKVGCVNGGRFTPSENKALPLETAPVPALSLKAGDILISRANTRDLVGSAAVVERDFPNLMLCDKLYRLIVNPHRSIAKFIGFYLGADAPRGQIELAATGASNSMLNIGQPVVLNLDIPLPPVEEQLHIVRFLDEQTVSLDALTSEAKAATMLLQERRIAFIAAAVTGKIDLRCFPTNAGEKEAAA